MTRVDLNHLFLLVAQLEIQSFPSKMECDGNHLANEALGEALRDFSSTNSVNR